MLTHSQLLDMGIGMCFSTHCSQEATQLLCAAVADLAIAMSVQLCCNCVCLLYLRPAAVNSVANAVTAVAGGVECYHGQQCESKALLSTTMCSASIAAAVVADSALMHKLQMRCPLLLLLLLLLLPSEVCSCRCYCFR